MRTPDCDVFVVKKRKAADATSIEPREGMSVKDRSVEGMPAEARSSATCVGNASKKQSSTSTVSSLLAYSDSDTDE
jgi:hypothetical protein